MGWQLLGLFIKIKCSWLYCSGLLATGRINMQIDNILQCSVNINVKFVILTVTVLPIFGWTASLVEIKLKAFTGIPEV